MSEFEAVIGLEVHAELLTHSKIFCGCSAAFGGEANTHVCPVCLGLPGVLPVLNRQVVELALRTALATNSTVTEQCKFDRKNYFYPDLPKGYQVSQYDLPIATGGWLDIEADGQPKRVNLTRIHMEEDAGKLVHAGSDRMAGSHYSLVDLNRAGVPLLEIVSEPEMRTSAEARAYLAELRGILTALKVCDGKMEEGSMRCDANVSVRPAGSQTFGVRVEIKNLNSFRSLQRAVDYEIQRQIRLVENNEPVARETRLWEENRQVTLSMRGKEEEHDYRYFPEPDLVLLQVTPEWVSQVREGLPELPAQKRKRYTETYGLSDYDARVLVADTAQTAIFEETLAHVSQPKVVANWLTGDISAYLNEHRKALSETFLTAEKLAEMLQLIEKGTISGKIAKTVLVHLLEQDTTADRVVQDLGLTQISDTGELSALLDRIVAESPKQVEQYLGGKTKMLGYFVGEVMKATKGRADPGLANRLAKEKLDGMAPQ